MVKLVLGFFFFIVVIFSACTKQAPLVEKGFVDTKGIYQSEVEKQISDWKGILEDLRKRRNMYPVNSADYDNKGQAILFLETQLSELGNAMNALKEAPESGWADYRAQVDAKLSLMKNHYYRPSAE